jgi:hypothetical protein
MTKVREQSDGTDPSLFLITARTAVKLLGSIYIKGKEQVRLLKFLCIRWGINL